MLGRRERDTPVHTPPGTLGAILPPCIYPGMSSWVHCRTLHGVPRCCCWTREGALAALRLGVTERTVTDEGLTVAEVTVTRFTPVIPAQVYFPVRPVYRGFRLFPELKVDILAKHRLFPFCSTQGTGPPECVGFDKNLTVPEGSERCVLVRNLIIRRPWVGEY